MDAPAMLTSKHVPEDVGLRNTVEDEGADGGQGQLHRDEKQHKPMMKKMKEKVKQIKNTLAGHGHGGEHVDDGRGGVDGGSTSGEEDVLEREAAMEKGGYVEEAGDKPVVMESEPEVHGAPMHESATAPAVQDLVARCEPARIPAAQEVEGDDAPRVQLGGPAVEDPAAPRSTTPAAREGEDIGTTPVVRAFESMTVSDDPPHVGAGKKDAPPEEWKDAAAEPMDSASGDASYTNKLKNAAAGTTEYGKKLATTVYEKVAGVGPALSAGKRNEERTEAVPMSDAGGEEWKDAAATDATDNTSGAGYTGKIKSAAAGTTEYGKHLATTVYDKVASVGTAVAPNLRPQVGVEKPEDGRNGIMPVSDAGADELKETAATDATDSASGGGYTDKIKSAAAGTTVYGKQLATTVYEKVAGVGTAVVGKVQHATHSAATATPGVGTQQEDTSATVTPGSGQDKGVTMTGYIAEKLRPGDEDRALSKAISGSVHRRKDAGGNEAKEGVAVVAGEEPVRGEEVGDRKLNTNTM